MRKIITNKEEKYYWDKGDLHTKSGMFKEEDIKNKSIIELKGDKFFVLDANFQDRTEKILRGPAIIVRKDIGAILAHVDIDKYSTVLDAGIGSGMLSIFLSKFVKQVIAYENNKDFLNIAKKNIESLNIKNINLKEKDIYSGIDGKNLDLITLDLKEPSLVLKHALKSLKKGKYLVSYLPNITQVIALINNANGFFVEKVLENIEREWLIDERRARPKNIILGHTGFLVFMRKI